MPILLIQMGICYIKEEIKNNKVVLEWNSKDYPQFIETTTEKISSLNTEDIDYMHFNTIIIDPKDNNLILSFAKQSSLVKINRQSGKIMWVLGGYGDEFGLSDKVKFIGQHTPFFINSNEIVLFDNASTLQQQFAKPRHDVSSILHLTIDEKNKKITD